MVVFDNPGPTFQQLPFEERYHTLLDSIIFNHPYTVSILSLLSYITK